MTAQDLKNSILQLAVQGKIVPQDPCDEPASELLKRIYAEKTVALKAGVIKKDKKFTSLTEEDIPYDIPNTWSWMRLGELCQLLDGEKFSGIKYPYLEAKYLRGKIEANFLDSGKFVKKGTRLILVDGENSGEVFFATEDGYMGSTFKVLYMPEAVYEPYILNFLLLKKQFFRNNKTGAAIPHLNKELFFTLPIPIPPYDEQKRIVSKINELMPLVESYGEAEKRLKELNAEFPDKLRKSILQQAVQGKLTERDPSGEPASELLKRIRTEKAKLIADEKIKKEKPLPPITDEEKPFDIPDTWEWERVGNLFSVIRGSSPRPKGSPLYWSSKETEFYWVTIKDISDHTQNGVMYKTHEYLTELGSTLSTYVEKGELIVAVSGSTTGKFCVLGINGFIYDGLAAVLNPLKIISSEYLKVFYSWVYQILNSKKIGSAFPNINTDVLKNTLIPIPPLEEQKRIVARVEELLAVCDGLK